VLLALGLEIRLGRESAPREDRRAEGLVQQYRQPFTSSLGDRPAPQRIGPDSEQCVVFEPEGLRITLPAGYEDPLRPNKERSDTGVSIPLIVKGDFEITVRYEILNEPLRADSGFPHTRLTLDVAVDRQSHVEATVSRRVCKWGGTQLLAWVRRHEDGQDKSRFKEFRTQSKSGHLRLVRRGAVVSYYAAEGPDELFTLLQQYPFSSDPVEDIRIVASTGGPKAALDARFTDLRVRADSLNAAIEPAVLPANGKGGSAVVLGIVLASMTALSAVILFWQLRRARTKTDVAASITQADATPDSIRFSFPCSHCGKKLRAGADLSGKQVRCPGCGNTVQVTAIS
jgi:hypothetical protein